MGEKDSHRMSKQPRHKLRAAYEAGCEKELNTGAREFIPEDIIKANDVGLALLTKHFSRPPTGRDEIFSLVEQLIDDLRSEAPTQDDLAGIPNLLFVLASLVGNSLKRPGVEVWWVGHPESGIPMALLLKPDWKLEEGRFIETDPLAPVYNAFLEGAHAKLRFFRDSTLAALEQLARARGA